METNEEQQQVDSKRIEFCRGKIPDLKVLVEYHELRARYAKAIVEEEQAQMTFVRMKMAEKDAVEAAQREKDTKEAGGPQ